jgi:4'-phosphopantetheinyl transferase
MQPRTLHVFWAEHDPDLPAVSQAGLQLPEAVRRRGEQYRTARQQNLSLLAKRLLLHGLRQLDWRMTGGLHDLGYRPGGKPFLANLPVGFSLSHSGQVAVCALCTDPVGIDVQEQRTLRPGSEGAFLTPTERLAAPPDERLAMWCGKEAAYKAQGYELGAGLRDFRFVAPLRVECPPVQLALLSLPLRPGYLCYAALPTTEPPPAPAVQFCVEYVPFPY